MMRNHGGFEGNGQTLRIVAKLEPFSEHHGMNLSRRTLLGLIKYPQTLDVLTNNKQCQQPSNFRSLKASEWHPPKGLYLDDSDIIDWVLAPLSDKDRIKFQQTSLHKSGFLKTKHKSLDCSIMELADDIAYGIHDLEDAIVTDVVNRSDFEQQVIEKLLTLEDEWLHAYCKTLTDKLFSSQHHLQKDAIGGLVNYLITAITLELNTDDDVIFNEPLLKYNATLPPVKADALQVFKDFVFKFVIKQPNIQRIEYRGQQVVMELFEALSSDPMRLLSEHTAKRWQEAGEQGLNQHRVIADYVAGMTDDYATKLYQTLFLPLNNDINSIQS